MAKTTEQTEHKRATLAVPRSRGALSGLALIALGAWGALLPYIGPEFNFGFGPDKSFHWTAPRLWMQLLPGVVTAVAGLFVLLGGNRVTGTFWAYLAAAAGVWFVVGPFIANLRSPGYVGTAIGHSYNRAQVESIAAFFGLGAAIIVFAMFVAGRMSIVGVRDVELRNRARETDDSTAATVATPRRTVTARTVTVRPGDEPVTGGPVRVIPPNQTPADDE